MPKAATATPTQQRIIDAMRANPEHKPKELAKDVGISEQSVRTHMTRLRKAGLIPGNGRKAGRKAGRPRRPIVEAAPPSSGGTVTPLVGSRALVAEASEENVDAGLPFAKEVVSDQLGHVQEELSEIDARLTEWAARKERLESDRDRLQQAEIALGKPEGAVLRHLPRTAGKRK